MTQFPDLFAALAAPFDPQEVRSRTQSGRQVQYITARVAMNRLDSVLGPENWWDEYIPGENSVLCRLTIRLADGQLLTKADAGGYAGMTDSGDDDKSGFSDAFKRACVKFGVGRYLYRDGVPNFGGSPPEASAPEPTSPPGRPTPAASDPGPPPKVRGSWGNGQGQTSGTAGPKSGRALFAWLREQETRHEVGLLKYLSGWGKMQGFPGKIVDWNDDQVALGYAEASRKLASIPAPANRGEAYDEALSN
jgi:hypothetical protein